MFECPFELKYLQVYVTLASPYVYYKRGVMQMSV